jgi:serine/threonine-protein kinase
MASASIPAQPGEMIAGKYQVERVLGMGGVGMVVAARHVTLGQMFAIKFLLPNAAHDENDVRRFMREAQSAVQLKNEHVTRVIDIAELDDGSPYIVLEYLEGQDLGATLRMSGPLPTVEAVGYILQACEAVAEAHAVGMVHRDLKPSNFFLTFRRDGSPFVKVLDFGIAKYKIEFEQQDVRLTQTRALLGSPVYMSPEQVRSARSVDPRSDIWSLGVSLFELLADTVPFGGETVTGVAAAVTSDPVPPIARYRPDVPQALAAILEKCLAKRPEERFQSIAELAEALVPFGPPEGIYSLRRISGVLGLRTLTADTDLRDSVRNGIVVSSTQMTQIAADAPTIIKHRVARNKRVFAGAFALTVLGIGTLLLSRSTHLQGTTENPSAATSVPKEAASSVIAKPDDLTRPPTVTLAPATPTVAPTEKVVTATPQNKSASITKQSLHIDTATKKKSVKKSFAGGTIDDIVDTRH